jgi:hypothetical protein
MRQVNLRILAVTFLATISIIPAYTQGTLGATGGGGGVGAAVASGTFVGPGGITSSRSDNNGQTFTYKFPKGATVFVTTGAPYAGRTSSQTIRTLANGTHLTQQSFDQPMTYRDTMGRTRTDLEKTRTPEMMPAAAAANFPPQIMRLPEITDPVAGYRIILDPVHQIAHRVAVQARQNQAPNPNVTARIAANQMPARTREDGATVKSENLGTQAIFGVTAIGQRTTTTYPVGTYQGNDQPVTQMNENWRSVQYGLALRSLNSGPNGDTTMTMKDFSLDEPDPSLFQIPAGYQIVDETGEFTITIPRDAR